MSTAVVKNAYQCEQVAATYDQQRFASPVGRLFDRLEKRAIGRVVAKAARGIDSPALLDIPCGTGRITELLLQQGYRVTGGDISSQMIDVARRKCERFGDRASYRQLDLDRLDLPDGNFDIVTCIRLFHHLDTQARRRVLAEAGRVARRAVVVNVSYSSPIYRLRRGVKRRLRQGVSRESSTHRQIIEEAGHAGLHLRQVRFVLPWASEDAVLLFEKRPAGAS